LKRLSLLRHRLISSFDAAPSRAASKIFLAMIRCPVAIGALRRKLQDPLEFDEMRTATKTRQAVMILCFALRPDDSPGSATTEP